jgi:cytochrome b561
MIDEGYGRLARWLHWLVAAIVIFLLPVGLIMLRLGPGETQDNLFVLHESFGMILLGLMLLRTTNRLRAPPHPAAQLTETERRLSLAVHRGLYALLLATPIIGWFGLSAFGLDPSFFWVGHGPALVAKNEDLSKALFQWHLAGALLIAALASLHIAGAIMHARRGDGLLSRMSLLRRNGSAP